MGKVEAKRRFQAIRNKMVHQHKTLVDKQLEQGHKKLDEIIANAFLEGKDTIPLSSFLTVFDENLRGSCYASESIVTAIWNRYDLCYQVAIFDDGEIREGEQFYLIGS